MRILITGICGFAGSTVARGLVESWPGVELFGLENFSRAGSELNRRELPALGIKLFHGDVRVPSDLAAVPKVDWVIDAAANPSVLAGVDGASSSRQVVEHNLLGTVNLLEFCRAHGAGFILLSTSRVYSIPALSALPLEACGQAFQLAPGGPLPAGVSAEGITESFSTAPPVSLYGSTKLASEQLALEYGESFGFPVWINRCGVLAGAGQFGRADQGIFSFWIHSHRRRRPLKFIGFEGRGIQVRDCLHPRDLVPLLIRQMQEAPAGRQPVQNVSGGRRNSMSLAQLHAWCDARFGPCPVQADPAPRRFDLPWVVLDSSLARKQWGWEPTTTLEAVLTEIAAHAEAHPDWLEISGG